MLQINETITAKERVDKPDYEQEIIAIIRSGQSPKVLRDQLEDYHENDIADAIPELTVQERKKLFHLLDIPTLSDILEYMDEDVTISCLKEMDLLKAASVVSEMDSDYAADLLDAMPEDRRARVLNLMDEESKQDVQLLASFDDDEIGSKMSTDYIVINRSLSVKAAMRELISQAEDNNNVSTIYVVDDAEVFYGAVDLRELIIARQDTVLEDLAATSFPYVYAHESIDDCIEELKDYSEDSIPVLDSDNRVLGVITSQNLIEVVDEEMGEDYALFAGLTAEEDLSETLIESMKKRLPWLIILLFLGLMVSAVVSAFERVVAQLTLIMAFQSLILDMSGNVGTQSLAVTIRVLMDETLTARQKVGLIIKESRVGFCNGLVLGSASFLVVGLFLMIAKGLPASFAYAISGCIGLSMVIAMLVSSAVGTVIPLAFKQIHVDPAAASGPLITTVNDLVAVVVYYSLSWFLLLQVLHLAG
ncbi:MAG: magnesium transporter [Clostridiales bacterium]|nr:magnesium transporter [Clostridiales bacterium]